MKNTEHTGIVVPIAVAILLAFLFVPVSGLDVGGIAQGGVAESLPEPLGGVFNSLLELISSILGEPSSPMPAPVSPSPAMITPAEVATVMPVVTASGLILVIYSLPQGAEIVLDQEPAGTTPYTATGLAEGNHTIGLSLAGYEDAIAEVALKEDSEITFPLTEKTPASISPTPASAAPVTPLTDESSLYGGICIRSIPKGARITIDGKKINGVTPYVVFGLKQGTHSVVISNEKGIFPVSSRRVYVFNGNISNVEFNFKPASGKSIHIESDNFKGDEFTLNGHFPSYRIPSLLGIIESGSYISILHNGTYISKPVSDFLNTGDTMTVLETPGTLTVIHVDSLPSGADVMVDGFPTGKKTPCEIPNLSEGRHIITASLLGYMPLERELILTDDPTKVTDEELLLPLESYAYGELKVTSNPPGAKIYLDGTNTGRTTPWLFRYRSIGSYSLKVVSGSSSRMIDVLILPGTVRDYSIDFVENTIFEKKYPTGISGLPGTEGKD
jgi:hypothetical protein